jgi:hypothetical protein
MFRINFLLYRLMLKSHSRSETESKFVNRVKGNGAIWKGLLS